MTAAIFYRMSIKIIGCHRSVKEKQSFEAQLDDIQRRLAAFVAQSKGDDYLPLTSSAVDKIAEDFKVSFTFYS